MKLLGAACGAAVGTVCIWFVSAAWTANLPQPDHRIALWAVLASAAAIGALSGAAIAARTGRTREQLAVFSGLAAAVAGGILGCILVLAILLSYVLTYAGWPADHGDQILMVLAFPALGTMGFFLGAGMAGLLGLFAGNIVRLVAPRR